MKLKRLEVVVVKRKFHTQPQLQLTFKLHDHLLEALELNRLIDSLMHPYFSEYPALIVVDTLLHAMVEQDLNMSLTKFVRYNVPKLLRHLARKQ